MLSEELGLQKLLEGREGRPCSGSTRQFVPPTWNYKMTFLSVCVLPWITVDSTCATKVQSSCLEKSKCKFRHECLSD